MAACRLSLVVERGLPFVMVQEFLIAVASLVEHRL